MTFQKFVPIYLPTNTDASVLVVGPSCLVLHFQKANACSIIQQQTNLVLSNFTAVSKNN